MRMTIPGNIGRALYEVQLAGCRKMAEMHGLEEEVALKDLLLDAVLSGDYAAFADLQASVFWQLVEEGVAPVGEYRALFAALLEKCPALRNPLRIALQQHSPFNNLVGDEETVDNVGS